MKVTIYVTRENIINSNQSNAKSCAIAQAAKETLPEHIKVDVGPHYFIIRDMSDWIKEHESYNEIAVPHYYSEWILRFDRNRNVEPIVVEIEIPDSFLKKEENWIVEEGYQNRYYPFKLKFKGEGNIVEQLLFPELFSQCEEKQIEKVIIQERSQS